MAFPIDIPAVFKSSKEIGLKEARETPISVSVYIDGSAPGEVVGHVRSAFASEASCTRVTVEYLDSDRVTPHIGDDAAILVAGFDERVGDWAGQLRNAGIPAMVVTTMPNLVTDMAMAFGHPIPEGDLASPVEPTSSFPPFIGESMAEMRDWIQSKIPQRLKDAMANGGPFSKKEKNGGKNYISISDDGTVVGNGTSEVVEVAETAEVVPAEDAVLEDPYAFEPIALDDERREALNLRMGRWLIAISRPKKLAMALSFKFVRRPLALESVSATSLQNMGVGVLVFIPGADLPVMTLNQAKMVLQIAAAYNLPLAVARVKELACVVGGAFVARGIVRKLVTLVPGLGWAIKGGMGYAATEAMGHAAIDYFEAGGDLKGVAGVLEGARDEAIEVAQSAASSTVGQKVIGGLKDAMDSVVKRVKER